MTSRRSLATTVLALIGAVTACGGSDPAIVVTVEPRPAVSDFATLEITLANAGATQTEVFDLEGRSLPTTFSVTVGGRTGPIEISARALDGDVEFARGRTTVDASVESATLLLDPADFVVNTEFTGAQFLNQDVETNGFQISAAEGTVTIGFRDDCAVGLCNQLGRRFGADGRALSTDLGAGTNQFRWNQTDGMFAATVGVGSQPSGSVAVWDSPAGVQCRSMSADGQSTPSEVSIAPDTGADVVSAVPLADGTYSVVWTALDALMIRVVRAMVISSTCATRINSFTAAGPVTFANRPTLAATTRVAMLAWIEDFAEARFRIGTSSGVFTPSGSGQIGAVLVSVPQPDQVDFVRVAALDNRFAVIYRRQSPTVDARYLRRTDEAGIALGPDTLIATDVDYGAAAVVARPSDGAIAVAWGQCDDSDGSGCGVYARLFRPSGVPVGPALVVNTTTSADQTDPSIAALDDGFVVAFTDASADPPDIAESAVRARFIYPDYDTARGVVGAPCADSAECGADLICTEDADIVRVCHATCDLGGPAPVCPGGGTCTPIGAEAYCRF
jgi:hypothetical protein